MERSEEGPANDSCCTKVVIPAHCLTKWEYYDLLIPLEKEGQLSNLYVYDLGKIVILTDLFAEIMCRLS
jgi:hypothetical protein